MNKEKILQIVDAGIKGNSLDLTCLTEDEESLKILREQTFQSFLYPVGKNPAFKKYYIASCLIHEQFSKMGEKIKSLFDDNGIDHIFLKGYTLQYLYPDPNLRMLGDIDVLVRNEDYKRAKKILHENGFEFLDEWEHHAGFRYGKLETELHRKLIASNEKFAEFFVRPFDHAKVQDGHTYALEDEYNFMFILAHYYKHLRVGAGLRELCDIYLMLEKLNLDADKIRENIKICGMENFFDIILTELHLLFGYDKLPYEENPHVSELIDYSLTSGIHGFGTGGDVLKNRIKNGKKQSKFSFLLKTLFVPVKTMFLYYPWTKSIILLPFGYIARFFHLILFRRDKMHHVLEIDDNENGLFEKLGLSYDGK